MATRSQTQPQGFPQLQAPLVKEGGYINQPWYQLLVSLWNRTGAGQGGSVSPTGAIVGFGGTVPPDGWVFCDGSAVSRTTYASLFQIIGTHWGIGDGSSTFNLPDLRGRAIVGANATYPLANTGGAASVTLSVGQLPSHTHAVTDPGHVHTALVASSTNTAGAAAGTAVAGNTGSAVTGISIDNTGGGNPVSTLPPYGAAYWIIKT